MREPYFDSGIEAMIVNMSITPNRWQTYLSSNSMLSFIASVMLGVLVGLFTHATIGASISVAVATAVTLAVANFFALQKISTAF